jgi:hypothetical protein
VLALLRHALNRNSPSLTSERITPKVSFCTSDGEAPGFLVPDMPVNSIEIQYITEAVEK